MKNKLSIIVQAFNRTHLYLCMLLLVLALGCSDQQKPTHELDHFVPAHWPNDLHHAAELILARIPANATSNTQQVGTETKELDEILGWVPEIAADTDLGEQEWLPLFAECERLQKKLRSNIDDPFWNDLRELASQLKATHKRLQELLPPGWTDPSSELDDTQQDNQTDNEE